MKINKVLKKMRELEKKEKGKSSLPSGIPLTPKQKGSTGFHAKANSQEGASLQRSMGNRDTKAG
jgi:hypothetical protein